MLLWFVAIWSALLAATVAAVVLVQLQDLSGLLVVAAGLGVGGLVGLCRACVHRARVAPRP